MIGEGVRDGPGGRQCRHGPAQRQGRKVGRRQEGWDAAAAAAATCCGADAAAALMVVVVLRANGGGLWWCVVPRASIIPVEADEAHIQAGRKVAKTLRTLAQALPGEGNGDDEEEEEGVAS